MLDSSQKTPTLDTDQAKKALAWTQSLYTEKLHAESVLVKAPDLPRRDLPDPEDLDDPGRRLPHPSLQASIGSKFDWGVTYLPRDSAAATDLGGNAVVVTDGSKNKTVAAEFAKYLVTKDNMTMFCEKTTVLPVRKDLVDAKLDYATRPDLMPVFQKQATTMPDALVKTTTLPAFPGINQALVDSMDQFLSSPSASVDSVVGSLTSGIEKALRADGDRHDDRAPAGVPGGAQRATGGAVGRGRPRLAALLVFTVFMFVPLAMTVWYSLNRYSGFGRMRFLGLDNYRQIAGDPTFWQALLNTVVLTAITVPLGIVLGLGPRCCSTGRCPRAACSGRSSTCPSSSRASPPASSGCGSSTRSSG